MGKPSTVDLLAPTSLDYPVCKTLKILFTLVTKKVTLKRRSNVLSFPLQLVFPGLSRGAYLSNLVDVGVLKLRNLGAGGGSWITRC
jgi:hypothetical protein